ncbi:hypothetical protein NQ315_002704 [Exocentrus adspersus]|uniref:Regulatory protein zeste n=1 Tax=Exocentrus adspersus TaxID=1586481 RepID=A0AAV8VHW8_9CUCU|nr:hypothetical protein NQ315_002704 [Exocentrus adspersus]
MCENKGSYSNQEKVFLINLIGKYKSVIENKKTDSNTTQNKQRTWEKIADIYNSNFAKRSAKQLKKLWDNLKQKTRKCDSDIKHKTLLTGGGPPPEDDNDPINEMVRAIVPTINFEVKNTFDSVGQIKCLEKKYDTEESDINNIEIYYERDNGDEQSDQENDMLENITVMPLTSKHENVNETNTSQKQTEISPTTPCKKKKQVPLGRKRKLDTTTVDDLHTESALRIKKLQISIEQQEELHNLKIEVARAEKKFWEQKLNLLLNGIE